MISQTAEYALRAIVFLAKHPDTSCTNQRLSEACHLPAGYLAKVMQSLSRAALVRSQRGKRGGFTLALPANELTAYDVVQAVDPIKRITQCPLDRPDHCEELCPLHKCLDDAAAYLEQRLTDTSIAMLVSRDALQFPN